MANSCIPGVPSTKILARNTMLSGHRLGTTIVDGAHGFPYSKRLEGHKSCVNALQFSSGEGRFLASGGDDMWICLWDFHQEDITAPSYSLRLGGPKGNIFAIEFSATNKYLLCGGASSVVLKYDIASLGSTVEPFTNDSPNQLYVDNDESIRGITCHPTQDVIFMTASEDGTIRRYDVREPSPHLDRDIIRLGREISGIQYHPLMNNLFLTSDGYGDVLLWDARMAYTRNNTTLEGVLERYNTKLTRLSEPRLCAPEASSVEFDREGTKFAVTFLHYLPTIYSLDDPDPLAVLSAETQPDGSPNPSHQRTYVNACTMKHGAFGGPGMDTRDNLYAAGSDDFRGYVWKIPPLQELKEQREKYSAEEWVSSNSERIAFAANKQGSKAVPVEISTPFCQLTGHESIINTIAFHPYFLHVATAGVEKRIVLHSPTPSSPCTQNLSLSPTQVRQLAVESGQDRAVYMYALTNSISMDDVEEQITLSMFDHIIRGHADVDIFKVRRFRSSASSSDSEEDHDNSSMDDSSEDEDI